MQVFMIVSTSADGFIAQHPGQNSTTWTSQADRHFFRTRTTQAGVVVMGRTTFETIEPRFRPLAGRLNIIYTKNVATATKQYHAQGDWAADPSRFRLTQLQPAALIKQLADENYQEVAICGGASVYTQFLLAKVVDKLYLTIHPVLFGQGISFLTDSMQTQLRLEKTQPLDQAGTLLLEYQVLQ